jgi:asparagine synthase (glutamine-hydrolysing)
MSFESGSEIIALDIEDFFNHAFEISILTNGAKPVFFWQTYLYPLKAKIGKASPFFVGTLGEFARSLYFDYGLIAKIADIFQERSLSHYWRLGRVDKFDPVTRGCEI